MSKKISIATLLAREIEIEPHKYFAVDEDLPEIFFKTAEQIETEEWEELWSQTKH